MKFFSDLRLVTKFVLLGGTASVLLVIAIACYVGGTQINSRLFEEYRNHYTAMDIQIEQLYAQGFQTEQATRNILISPADQKAVDNFKKAVADYDDLFGKLSTLAHDTPLVSQLNSARKIWDEGIVLKRKVIDLATQGNTQQATILLKEQETPKWREYKTASLALSADLDKIIAAKTKEMDSVRSKTFISILVILLATVVTISGGMALIARGLNKRLQGIIGNLRNVAHGEGDLTCRVAVTSQDELGKMAELFNEAWDKLENITREVMEQATCIEAFGGQLGIESERISRGSRQIALQSTAVATASEEMSATAGDIAHSCTVAAEAAASANQTATEGSAVLMQSINAMNSIAGKVHEAAQTVTALGNRSDQIGAIVGTIEDIADQTNLLALNAAIEAARAGEQGRGFAVVADEVRALAERTTRATREIAEMIKNIQQETKKAVSIMEEGATEVEKGISESARSSEALNTILAQISSLTMQVSQIATAAEEQSATTGEIVSNISSITGSVDNFDRTTQHMNSKVGQLQSASETLKKTASTFKINDSPLLMLDTAKSDHVAFVHRIERCLDNRESIQPSALPDHKNCRFGKWYFSTGKEICGTSRTFQAINEPHEKIHRIAKEAVDLHNKGMTAEAEHLLEQVEDISTEIVEQLENVKKESKLVYT